MAFELLDVTRTSSFRLRNCASLLIACLGACTPRSSDTRSGTEIESRFDNIPLAWTSDSSILFGRVETRHGGDVMESVCDGTGLYEATSDGVIHRRAWGLALCDVLSESAGVALDAARQRLLLSRKDPRRGLVEFDLNDNSSSVIREDCMATSTTPSLSRGGAALAFGAVCGPNASPEILISERDSAGTYRAARFQIPVQGDSPSWSPTGEQLAVHLGGDLLESTIVVVSRNGRQRLTLAKGFAPTWSPSGDWIAFKRFDEGTSVGPSIWIVREDGTGRRRLTSRADMPSVLQPNCWISTVVIWSPDGNSVAFGCDAELVAMNIRERTWRVWKAGIGVRRRLQ